VCALVVWAFFGESGSTQLASVTVNEANKTSAQKQSDDLSFLQIMWKAPLLQYVCSSRLQNKNKNKDQGSKDADFLKQLRTYAGIDKMTIVWGTTHPFLHFSSCVSWEKVPRVVHENPE
jgi:hypothetical protein